MSEQYDDCECADGEVRLCGGAPDGMHNDAPRASRSSSSRVAAALPEEQRRELLDIVLSAVLVDGKLSPHERSMVDRITRALGL